MEAKIRKYQSNLTCSGLVAIAFGSWNLLRIILIHFLDSKNLYEMFGIPITADKLPFFEKYFIWIVLSILLVDLLLQIYIGRSAIKEGRGEKKSIFYLIFIFFHASHSLFLNMRTILLPSEDHVDFVIKSTVIIDITNCLALFVIFFSSIQLRRLQKQIKQG